MRKIVIATHGDFAQGLANTIKMFVGETADIRTICAFTKEEDPLKAFKEIMSELSADDEILVFTDIKGGSVNQYVNQFRIENPEYIHFHLISGVNMPLILELITSAPDEYLSEELILEKIGICKNEIIYMNTYTPDLSDIDD